MRTAALFAIALFAVGCPSSQLQNAEGDIAFVEPRVFLGPDWAGETVQGTATLRNRGRSPLTVEWTEPGGGFSFEGLPTTLPSGDTMFTVRYFAEDPGLLAAKLIARSGDDFAELTVTVQLNPIPACTPSACHVAVFDKAAARCVETVLPDGESCDPHSVCVTNARCQSGRCIGTPVICDDGNACTVDTCNAVTGCEFPPAPPCPGEGACQLGVCDPKTGCGLEPAADGTSCGSVTCDAAEVCMGGACVVRDPPDGYVCAEASPCQGQGLCQASNCVRPAVTPLAPTWSFDSAGGEHELWLHDFVLEPDGNPTLMGFFSKPILRAGSAALELSGVARRCILWNGQLACADYAQRADVNGQVTMIDLATGQERWTFRLAVARPDISAQADALFMARVVSMGSDRLGALFESYPKDSGAATQCRNYYLVVLDAGGGMVSTTQLADPLLSDCHHPHPYGVASDVDGNLYVSFSPSATGNAPLAPTTPTLLMSFNRDGVERWRRTEQYVSGELGVASGLLYPESAPAPHLASTGAPVATGVQRGPLGRVIASDRLYVSRPGQTLSAYFTRSNEPAWTLTLGANDFYSSTELRAATWTPRPAVPARELVLGWARRNGIQHVLAVDLNTGAEQWSCPIDEAQVSDWPQTFEVANGKLTFLGGAATCGECDPPFANSSARFWSFDLPGIAPSNIPWSGTFGGPGHDHLENGPFIGGGSAPN